MGSPITPLIANLFMEEFEVKAINSTLIPIPMAKVCRWHLCYPRSRTYTTVLQHIKSWNPHIQSTTKEHNQNGSLPFLDTLVLPDPDNILTTTVYSKYTHTDQYLHWDSNHPILTKTAYSTL